MKANNLLKLMKYAECPTCVNIELKNGKTARHKFEHFTSFIDKANRSDILKNAEIDDVFVQTSLLNEEKFIMIYGREEGVENGEI